MSGHEWPGEYEVQPFRIKRWDELTEDEREALRAVIDEPGTDEDD